MSENPRRSRQTRNFTTNVPKILDLKSSSEQIFFRKLSLGAPDNNVLVITIIIILLAVLNFLLHIFDVFQIKVKCQLIFSPV